MLKRSSIQKTLALFLLLSFVLAACTPGNRAEQNPLLGFFERKSGLIVYLGLDGNIHTMDQNAGKQTAITTDAVLPTEDDSAFVAYQQPVWSPNSEMIAFFGFRGDQNKPFEGTSTIYIYDLEDRTATPQAIYTTDTQFPSYLFWSPAGDYLAFISTPPSRGSQTLYRIPVEGGEPQLLDAGLPYNLDWAPDGQGLLIHAGGFNPGQSMERISFIQPGLDEVVERILPVFPGLLTTPDWAPNGEFMVVSTGVQDSEGQTSLIMSDREGSRIRNLKFYEGQGRVSISPDSSKIAFLQQQFLPDNGQYFGRLSVFDTINQETEEISVPEGNVIAFFWSPDSTKLAYFMYDVVSADVLNGPLQPDSSTEADQGAGIVGEEIEPEPALPGAPIGLVRMNVYDLEEVTSYPVVFSFYPTADFARMLLNFDQYNRSATIWSPDSNNIVLSGTPTVDGNPVILVVASSGTLEPRFLLDGVLAFWSWK